MVGENDNAESIQKEVIDGLCAEAKIMSNAAARNEPSEFYSRLYYLLTPDPFTTHARESELAWCGVLVFGDFLKLLVVAG